MPELPEVETVVRTLAPRVVGQTIAAVELLRADILRSAETDLAPLAGQTIRSIHRRGKKILIDLDDACSLCIHLGMTGRLVLEPPSAPRRKHTHLILHFNSPAAPLEVRFSDPRRFGGVWWRTSHCPSTDDAELGPEPLTLRSSALATRLARTKRVIKSALLDQRLIAGLGNIYVDESLFSSHIHPLTPANKLTRDQIARLSRSIKSVLRRAIAAKGSSLRDYVDATGQPGDFQKLHRVYDRKGHPCPRCKTPIARIVISARSTHFCPNCQRLHAKPASKKITAKTIM